MPADTTETVAEHSSRRLQPSINLHAPVVGNLNVQLLRYTDVLPRKDEGSGKP